MGCRLWGRTESDTTEVTQQQQQQQQQQQKAETALTVALTFHIPCDYLPTSDLTEDRNLPVGREGSVHSLRDAAKG